MLEFAEQEFPGEPMFWHTNYMACSTNSKLGLHQDRMDIGKVGSGEHLCVLDLVLPCYAKQVPPTGAVEVVDLSGMALLDHPRITAIEHSGKHYDFVDLDLCLRGDACSAPHILVESVEGSTCLGESGVDLVVDDKCAGKYTAKIRELVY